MKENSINMKPSHHKITIVKSSHCHFETQSSSYLQENDVSKKMTFSGLHESKCKSSNLTQQYSNDQETDDSGRERLKRHRIEVAGSVWIPDIWGQEELLKDWIDCSAFDAPLVPNRILSARTALVEEGRLRIENRC